MDFNPLHILLADDDEGDRLMFVEALQELKLKTIVRTVKDGAELLEYLTKEDTKVPYLLFLDLNMPRKNGLQCLKEIRRMERYEEMAIAIYSTSASEKDIEDTYVHGANVYIKKPNDFKLLKKVLDKVITAAYIYRETPFSISNFLFKI